MMFSKSDRLLVIAPHPDDESLASACLLQRAFLAQANVRIIFITSGDNNIWAQRFWEKRWRISASDRARWGNRRKEEALCAISKLGGDAENAVFWQFPDQGLTDLLMEGPGELARLLTWEIDHFQPSILIIPSTNDAHPDHSALGVLLSVVLSSASVSIKRVFEYVVHSPSVPILIKPFMVRLNSDEIETKRVAILAHQTQLAVGKQRFLKFARAEECYYSPEFTQRFVSGAPFLSLNSRKHIVNLEIPVTFRDKWGSNLLLVSKTTETGLIRARIHIPPGVGPGEIKHPSGESVRVVVHRSESALCFELPDELLSNPQFLYTKMVGLKLFFDRAGWSRASIGSREMVPITMVEGVTDSAKIILD